VFWKLVPDVPTQLAGILLECLPGGDKRSPTPFPVAWAAYNLIETPGRKWLRIVFEGSQHRRVEQVSSVQVDMP
jgi:hypothetical protein